jgi:hypothetical protein
MISGAKGQFTDLETVVLNNYLAKGGNLFWLTDPDADARLNQLDFLPPVNRLPGVIVDANAASLKLATPDNALVTVYPEHEVTRQITQHTLFPQATALEVKAHAPWQTVISLDTGDFSWNETGSLKGDIDRDPLLFERQGPLSVGILLQRTDTTAGQKLALFGDSDFIRNHMLGQGDNLRLALNLFYWLTHEGHAPDSPVIKPRDQLIELSETGRAILGICLLFLLPAVFISAGLLVPWKRKRRQ